MNPKIKELAEQATTIEVIHGRGFDTTQYTSHFDKEKFAKLIIDECIQVAMNAKSKEAAAMLVVHFGDGIE